MPFMNTHYVYALMRAGRDQAVDTALANIRERSIADDDEGKQVWSPVGCAVVEAAACFGAGNRARAAQLLDPVMPLMTSIGGSDAQMTCFAKLTCAACRPRAVKPRLRHISRR
jgi:hypothetical protein